MSDWRDIGNTGEPWPRWIGSLKGKSGAYAIRRKPGRLGAQVVYYVGESHTNHLRRTLTRHFQDWNGKTAGQTYAREDVQIKIQTTQPSKAVDLQNRWIKQLDPTDNSYNRPDDLSDVPF